MADAPIRDDKIGDAPQVRSTARVSSTSPRPQSHGAGAAPAAESQGPWTSFWCPDSSLHVPPGKTGSTRSASTLPGQHTVSVASDTPSLSRFEFHLQFKRSSKYFQLTDVLFGKENTFGLSSSCRVCKCAPCVRVCVCVYVLCVCVYACVWVVSVLTVTVVSLLFLLVGDVEPGLWRERQEAPSKPSSVSDMVAR